MNQRSRFDCSLLCALLVFVFAAEVAVADIPPADLQKIENALPAKAAVAPKKPRKLLVFTLSLGYKHESIPYAVKMLELMGKKTGAFEIEHSEDMAVFERNRLNQFDAVCFANPTRVELENPEWRKSLLEFVKSGKGIVGFHAATNNFFTWPEGAALIGGVFDEHPWHSKGTWAVKIDDPGHPLTRAFQGKNFKINDEIYRTKAPYTRERLRVLLSLDLTDPATLQVEGVRPTDVDVPISWIQSYGKGKVFYCALGHNPHIYWNPAVLQHYLDGIQFALGDLAADTSPSVDQYLAMVAKYEYGQSREPLTALNDFIRFATNSPEALQRLEQRFLKILHGDATLAGKQYLCKRPSLIGTDQSIPVLSTMLVDSATADMARFALERIPGSAVDNVLRKALSKARGNARIGIINTLGRRRDPQAVTGLRKLLDDPEATVVSAAVAALGKIANDDATRALRQALNNTSGNLRLEVLEAYLKCADQLLARGQNAKARAIYKHLLDPRERVSIRFAAVRGMVRAAPDEADKIVISALEDADPDMQAQAIKLIAQIPEAKTVEAITREFSDFSIATQEQLLAALAERGDPAFRPVAVSATGSESGSVRIAALKALSVLGDHSTVDLLANVAAAGTGEESETARESLYRLRGENVDAIILRNLPQATSKVKVELIRSVGKRGIAAATKAILETAVSPDPLIRLESIKALKSIAGPPELPALIDLLIRAPEAPARKALEATIAAVAKKIPEQSQQSQAVLNALSTVSESGAKSSLLHVLGRIGNREALPVLRQALEDDDSEVRAAAIRALSMWPVAEPASDLLVIAQSNANPVHQVLALRGYVRLIGLDNERPVGETVGMYRQAMVLAPSANEKKIVLSGLANVKAPVALEMAAEYIEDSTLVQEAEVAVVRIAQEMSLGDCKNAKSILQKIAATAASNSLRQDAGKLLDAIRSMEEYLTDWQVSGPYREKGVDTFEYAFPPETGDQSADWRPMPAGTNHNRVWRLELDRVIGGDDCAAYLRNQVWSDNDQEARLELGSDDGIKVWLNDQLVHANDVTRGVSPGADIVKVHLKQGWNQLMLKVSNKSGGWGACARLVKPDGSSFEELRVKAE